MPVNTGSKLSQYPLTAPRLEDETLVPAVALNSSQKRSKGHDGPGLMALST